MAWIVPVKVVIKYNIAAKGEFTAELSKGNLHNKFLKHVSGALFLLKGF